MECNSAKKYKKQDSKEQMALSYMQDAKLNAGLMANHSLAMTQELPTITQEQNHAKHRRSSSPVLNNNSNLAASLYGTNPQMATAASLSMMTPHQLMSVAAELSLRTMLAAGMKPEVAQSVPFYSPHNMFSGWVPSTSPPSQPAVPGPVSPALSAKSHLSATSVNYNNNKVISSNSGNSCNSTNSTRKKKTAGKRKKGANQNCSDNQDGSATGNGKDKIFTCDICHRSFGYKHVLQNHERTHTGEKPFKCHTCGKRFTRDHHLKTHIRLHTGEKPYICRHCNKRFVQIANLRRHERVHTGEKPFACDVAPCDACFSDSNQLKTHQLKAHNNITYSEKAASAGQLHCKNCNVSFARKQQLRSHKCAAANALTTVLPGNLVNAQLGGSTSSESVGSPTFSYSDDQENDNDSDIYMQEDEHKARRQQKQKSPACNAMQPIRQQQFSSPDPMPLNLSSLTAVELPEQTEPEDLSMASRSPQSSDSARSGEDSPMDRSSASDVTHEEEDNKVRDDNVDSVKASPNRLYVRKNLYDDDRRETQ